MNYDSMSTPEPLCKFLKAINCKEKVLNDTTVVRYVRVLSWIYFKIIY